MNKQEMKALALLKVQDKINTIINDINDNIRKCAEKGLFVYNFDTTKVNIGYDIVNIIVEDFSSRGFSIECYRKDNPIISIGWFRK